MPSCVVKTCRNNSMDVKKETGVTFHKFPKDTGTKCKWITIVRACRSQESWLPSKFSVICSAHFADGDIYTTQGGNRRIAKNAVPTLKLYETIPKKKKCDHTMTVENVSVSVQTTYVGSGDDEGLTGGEVITGDRESTVNRIENVIIKIEPTDMMETTGENSTQTDDPVENVTIKVEPKEPVEVSIDPLAPQQDIENLLADTSHFEQEIKKKNEHLKVCRKKIKILHQKVHRLQKRNLKLKNILKEIRHKKLIDRDIFRQLTADLVNNDD